MNPRNVWLIFRREIVDQLRDRRTLFMVAVLPLLLYPALGIGMMQLMLLFQERPRTVVLLGADQLGEPALLSEGHFAERWFRQPDDAVKLSVLSDASEPERPADRRRLELARDLVQAIADVAPREREPGAASRKGSTQLDPEWVDRFAASGLPVIVVFPKHFRERLAERGTALLADGRSGLVADALRPENDGRTGQGRPLVIHNSADENSLIAFNRVNEALARWEGEVLKAQLAAANLPADLAHPVDPLSLDLVQPEQLSATIWSKMFPALLVLMSLTGAFYPAIDLCAGEKERGTMETLLICPASRTDVVLGKFLTVMAFSVSTALLNLTSLGSTGQYMASLAASGPASRLGDLSAPPLSSLLWVLVLLVPLSALFSGLCLALATFARSTKEGQYYLTPLLMVVLGLVVFCISPAVEMTPFYSLLPVAGPSLLLKGLLKGGPQAAELGVYLAPVLLSSLVYSLIALWWAIDQFSSEAVLFREAERFDLRTWLRHLLRDKDPLPSFSEAVVCFVLIMFLQFGAIKVLRGSLEGITPEQMPLVMIRLLIVQQLVIIATPALLMAILLTSNVRRTLRLTLPSWPWLAGAVVLALCLHPLTIELAMLLGDFFPPLPPDIRRVVALMTTDTLPLAAILVAFALAPALCEEVAFRGFILSGFERRGREGLAILFSAIAFGLMHLVPQQVFNATLLGLLLGWIALSSRSLLPTILFHFVYNSTEVLRGRLGAELSATAAGSSGWFWTVTEQGVRYTPLLLALCGLIAGAICWSLRRLALAERDAQAAVRATAERLASAGEIATDGVQLQTEPVAWGRTPDPDDRSAGLPMPLRGGAES